MLNLSPEDSSYLLAIIGIANTIGRIVLGFVTSRPRVNRLYIYISCLLICGFGEKSKWKSRTLWFWCKTNRFYSFLIHYFHSASAVSAFCDNFETLAVYAMVFGITLGALVGLTSVILVDLLGIDKLTNAFGLLLLFQGIGSFIGPPIAGCMYDHTQSYTASFLFAGISMVLSGLLLYLSVPILQRNSNLEKQQQYKANTTSNTVNLDTNNGKIKLNEVDWLLDLNRIFIFLIII